jgi:hypothetical protein
MMHGSVSHGNQEPGFDSSNSRTGRECANTFPWFWMDGNGILGNTAASARSRPCSGTGWESSSSCPPCWFLFVLFTPPAEVVWDLRTGTCWRMRSRVFDSPANAFSAWSLHRSGVSNTPRKHEEVLGCGKQGWRKFWLGWPKTRRKPDPDVDEIF